MRKIGTLANELAQTSSQTTSTNPAFSDEVMLKIGRLFVRLALTYGHLWSSQFKNDEILLLAKREWAKSIGDYSDQKLDEALERCKAQFTKAPSLAEFMTCLQVSQYQAMLNEERKLALPISEAEKEKKWKRSNSSREKAMNGLDDNLKKQIMRHRKKRHAAEALKEKRRNRTVGTEEGATNAN